MTNLKNEGLVNINEQFLDCALAAMHNADFIVQQLNRLPPSEESTRIKELAIFVKCSIAFSVESGLANMTGREAHLVRNVDREVYETFLQHVSNVQAQLVIQAKTPKR